MRDDDTLIIDLDKNGAVVAIQGKCKAKNWKRQLCKLKEVLSPE